MDFQTNGLCLNVSQRSQSAKTRLEQVVFNDYIRGRQLTFDGYALLIAQFKCFKIKQANKCIKDDSV